MPTEYPRKLLWIGQSIHLLDLNPNGEWVSVGSTEDLTEAEEFLWWPMLQLERLRKQREDK